jgi:hypothetical protein
MESNAKLQNVNPAALSCMVFTAGRIESRATESIPLDKRRVPRQRTLKTGKIAFNGGKSVIDCTVRNRSPLGASLVVAAPIGIPDHFELWMDGDHIPCVVIWRKPTQIGVEFEARQGASA